jgi:hypothetical protein
LIFAAANSILPEPQAQSATVCPGKELLPTDIVAIISHIGVGVKY